MLIRIYPENPNPREMAKALKALRDGELVVYPTDTVYAIGCDALNVRAVEKICALKGVNPQKSNLSIICYDLSNISEYAQVSNAAFKLLKKNLPGPFTFILPTSSRLPKIYKNRKEVGIRVPDNSIARGLVAELGNPILTMSVHDEDEVIEYSTDPELIHEKYGSRVALVIDGGYGGAEASTVVNCVDDSFDIVRQGKALYVGLSKYPYDVAGRAYQYLHEHDVPCLLYQGRYNLFNQAPAQEHILEQAREQGAGFIAFSPLAQGLLTSKYLKGIPKDSRMARGGFLKPDALTPEVLARIEALNDIALRRGQTLAEMALAWLLKDETVTSVIVGASSVEQLDDNLKALQNTNFSEEELKEIDEALSK